MKKTLFTTIAFCLCFLSYAGGLLTNTNQNVRFLRNPARGASMEIDAVYSNPAGLAFLKNEGWHLSLNVQSAFQTRTINSTFAPFAGYGGSETKEFEGKASAPFIPSLQAAYKMDKWAFSASFAVTGGGGKATFDKGLGSFESQVALIPILLSQYGYPTNQYSVKSSLEGAQIIYGFQLGATYKITDYLSAFVGGRMNYVNNGYFGYIRDIHANVGGGPMVNLHDFFTTTANTAALAAEQYLQAGDMENYEKYATIAATALVVAEQTQDKELDCTQTGWGVTPILGADFKWKNLNVGIKYEFNTHLNVENKTKRDDTGLFADGVNTPHDIPSLLTVGVSYKILPVLSASVGYHHFFDKNAKMANDKQEYLSGGTHEFLFGLEWDVAKWVQVSAGAQRTDLGVTDNYMTDLSFSIDSWSFGFGAGFRISDKWNVNVAYFWTNYEDYTKEMSAYNGNAANIPGTDVFHRTSKVFGVGVDYRF